MLLYGSDMTKSVNYDNVRLRPTRALREPSHEETGLLLRHPSIEVYLKTHVDTVWEGG